MAVLTLRLDDQLERKLQRLSKETERPKSHFVKKALALYRWRTGRFRVIYEVRKDVLIILVMKIWHRKDIYRS